MRLTHISSLLVVLFAVNFSTAQTPIYSNPSSGQVITQPSGTTIAINSLNSTTLNADLFAGSDIGAKIAAADTSLGTAPGTISINTAGTISTSISLSANHNLLFTAPVNISTPVTLTGSNRVSCSGPGAVITSSVSGGTGIFLGASAASGIEIEDCTFNGSIGTYMFSTSTSVTNFTMKHNHGIGTSLFTQTTSAGIGSSNVIIEGNSSVYAQGTSGTQASVEIYGAFQHIRIIGNYFEGGGDGVALFVSDGSGQPTLAQIIAFGGTDATVSGNTCKRVNACSWGSGMFKVTMSSNIANDCGDVCFDAEGSANVEMIGNSAQGAGSAEYSLFFSGFNNSVVGNTAFSNGEAIFAIRNSGQNVGAYLNTKVSNNQFYCNTSSPCQWAYLDSNTGADLEGNTVINGIIGIGGYSNSLTVRNNHIFFDIATSSGLAIPTALNGTSDVIEGNVIDSTYFPQSASVPCLIQNQIDYNNYDVFYFRDNHCIGGWGTAMGLYANGGNPGIGVIWVVKGNVFPNLNITPGGGNPNRTLLLSDNCLVNSLTCDNSTFTHSISGGTAPTVSVLSGAGSGASVALSPNSTDSSGFVYVNFGSGPTSGSPIFQLTFGSSWYAAPKCWLAPASLNTAVFSATAYVDPSSSTTTNFQGTLGIAPLTSSLTGNVWAYKCEQ